jgi:hypothetical protein
MSSAYTAEPRLPPSVDPPLSRSKGLPRTGHFPAPPRSARTLQPATKKFLWGLVVVAMMGWQSFSQRPVKHPAGMMIPEEPVQGPLPSGKTAWMVGDNRIQPLATYRIKARVLHTERYRWDTMADLSPLDLGVGWRVMSDETWATQSEFSNSSRYLSWHYDSPDFPGEAAVCISNMHLLPAKARVRDRLLSLRRGELVELSGYLVEVQRPGMNPWTSSLTRLDSGDGACEIMWVEAASSLDRRPAPGKNRPAKN